MREGRVLISRRVAEAGERGFVSVGRTAIVEPLEDALLELRGPGSAVKADAPEAVLPPSWKAVLAKIRSEKPKRVAVVGGIDTGKTTLALLIYNELREGGVKAGFLEEDVGQNEVAAPTTVCLASSQRGVFDLRQLELVAAEFVGDITPTPLTERVLECVSLLLKVAAKRSLEALVVDTDGWVKGKGAADFKARLIAALECDLVVCTPPLSAESVLVRQLSSEIEVLFVDVPSAARRRSFAERRHNRERCFEFFMKGERPRRIRLDEVTLWYEHGALLPIADPPEPLRSLGTVRYAGEGEDRVVVIIEGQVKSLDDVWAVEQIYGKPVDVRSYDRERGLVSGLYAKGRFQGLGVITQIDPQREELWLRTPVTTKPSAIMIGRYMLPLSVLPGGS